MADAVRQPRPERVSIDKIIPYWRNPRVLSEDAVAAVAASIQQYGYAQPVVVDADLTIIIGHTRYAAMRQLGLTEIDVLVVDYLSTQEVKQLRVVDNRAGEYAFWDFEKLQEEIGESESKLLSDLFPEILSEFDPEGRSVVTRDFQIGSDEDEVDPEVDFVCPKCFHEWTAEVTRDQIMSGRIDA
jgi:hypothetical protein